MVNSLSFVSYMKKVAIEFFNTNGNMNNLNSIIKKFSHIKVNIYDLIKRNSNINKLVIMKLHSKIYDFSMQFKNKTDITFEKISDKISDYVDLIVKEIIELLGIVYDINVVYMIKTYLIFFTMISVILVISLSFAGGPILYVDFLSTFMLIVSFSLTILITGLRLNQNVKKQFSSNNKNSFFKKAKTFLKELYSDLVSKQGGVLYIIVRKIIFTFCTFLLMFLFWKFNFSDMAKITILVGYTIFAVFTLFIEFRNFKYVIKTNNITGDKNAKYK